MVHATTILAYPKWPCVCFKVNICYTYYMILSFQTLLLPSIATLWPVTVNMTESCDLCQLWQWCHAKTLTLVLRIEDKRKEKKKKITRKVKRNLGLNFVSLTMTTKGLSRKQVIVPINNDNKTKFMKDSCNHVTNLNSALKNTKSEIMVNFIWSDQSGITIITNKVASSLELQTIENYIKDANYIKAEGVEVPHLPQSKSYLKIIGILYLVENTNTPITSVVVGDIIKKNHIFNNITLASKPYIIKVFPKSDMAIIWLNIWDIQSRIKAQGLINKCFNVESYIMTIRSTNMNSRVVIT